MNRALLLTTLTVSMGLAATAFGQTAPVGGPDAKGNAPLKQAHTVNDGSAKPGANSFTQGQARQHILKSGYTNVSGLTKGHDGVWRGSAMHNGAQVDVAMDFKGNVTEGAPATTAPADAAIRPSMRTEATAPVMAGSAASTSSQSMSATNETTTHETSSATTGAGHHHHHRRHHHHHHHNHHGCANPGPNGAACSGVDRNMNGVSDKEDHAMQAGSHP